MPPPARDAIEKLLRGQLDPEAVRALCRQLEDEAEFERMAAGFADDTTFLDLLNNASLLLTKAPDPEVERLIRRFRESAVGTQQRTVAGSGLPPFPANATPMATWIGGFRIVGKLGEGGMGAVYLAEDPTLERKVALKVMRPEVAALGDARERFLREARAAAKIKHDNVVDIYQVGEDGGAPFIAMPLLEGESLEDRLRREAVSPLGVVLKLGREVALGLEAAHGLGLVHRDIKPANIWIEGDPNSADARQRFRRAKILDFGLARFDGMDVKLTSSGAIMGSPLFMSPEQGRGLPVDARSDLFSLGVVLYRMSTGKQPFTGETIMAVLTSLAVDTPPPPKEVNPELPVAVSDLIVRLMDKQPTKRHQTAKVVVEEIEGHIRAMRETAKSVTSGTLPTALPVTTAPKPLDSDIPIPQLSKSEPASRTAVLPRAASQQSGDRPKPPGVPKWVWIGGSVSILMLGVAVVVLMRGTGEGTNATSPRSDAATTESAPLGPIVSAPKPIPIILPSKPIPTVSPPTRNDSPPSKPPFAGEEVEFEIAKGVKMKFCWIPAGECQLGSPKAEQDYLVEKYLEGKRPDWLDAETESARGKYKSGGFWLGKYPVTQAEYEALIGSNPSKFKGDLLPVETASWDDAQAYMKKLNEGSAGSGLRRTMGEKSKFALPHEDAWEYACRGGLGNGRAFYWGDSLDGDKANCDGNGPYGTQTKGENLKRTTEVGSYVTKAPHPWGLCDTSGNVWQWCDNLYTKEGSSRVFRGGSWFNDAWGCRSANRNRFDPSHRSVNVGFRLAVPPSEGGEEAK